MLRAALSMLAGLTLCFSAAVYAVTPPTDAPTGTTAKCKDNSYYSGASKRGACSRHGGIAEWYGSADSAKAATAPANAAAEAPGAKSDTSSAKSSSGAASSKQATSAPAPGGGPGKVWVNTASKVYHCQGDRYYGKTKQGEYMTEAAAKAAGDRPDHGKPCS